MRSALRATHDVREGAVTEGACMGSGAAIRSSPREACGERRTEPNPCAHGRSSGTHPLRVPANYGAGRLWVVARITSPCGMPMSVLGIDATMGRALFPSEDWLMVVVSSDRAHQPGGSAERLIRCEACGACCPEGPQSCPNCGMPVRRESTYRMSRSEWRRSRSRFVPDDVEGEVRDKLYGGRTGCVEVTAGG